MKTIALLSTVLTLHGAAAPSLKLIAEVKGFASPESVATDGSHYFVSNVGKELKPTDKDGDGFISRMGPKGENLELRFIDGLNAPKGLLVQDGTLFVCDVDTLLAFDLATKKKSFELSFAKDGVKFLNDVCAAPNGRLIVSATDQNKLYLVSPKDQSFAAIQVDKAPKGPNGLAFITDDEDTYLLVAEWGSENKPNGSIRCYALDPTLLKGTEEDPGDDFPVKAGYQDGLAILSEEGEPMGVLYSDWVDFKPVGKLFLVTGENGKCHDLTIPSGPVAGPADFLYEPKTSTIALPCMMEGRVLLMTLVLQQE
ncbi:MAG: hypothetical protein K9N23_11610 [Akkermansiaceae bacterium]|nr:hypothetical protein [Akkermansiaceae bacterium]MCF7732330.1 hypothetical protein [Akkermansiaceae bacterium]